MSGTTPQGIMFEAEVLKIRQQTRAIAINADMLTWLKTQPAALARYDLKKSIQELHDAASRLEDLMGKKVVWLEAAE